MIINILYKSKLVLLAITMLSFAANAQVLNPNCGLKSHPTLQIQKIETSGNETVVFFVVENQINNGWFCVAPKISLSNSLTNKAIQVLYADGIPECPQKYYFGQIGETLEFQLHFSAISENFQYIDIIENCDESCFYFKGIILNETFNSKLEKAYNFAEKANKKAAIEMFTEIINLYADYPYGLAYLGIISLYHTSGEKDKAMEWYRKYLKTNCKDKIEIEQILKQQGIL